jgi:hypothetical protein
VKLKNPKNTPVKQAQAPAPILFPRKGALPSLSFNNFIEEVRTVLASFFLQHRKLYNFLAAKKFLSHAAKKIFRPEGGIFLTVWGKQGLVPLISRFSS